VNDHRPLRVLLVSNMYPSEMNPHSGIFVSREARSLERAGVDVIVEPIAGQRGEWDYLASRRRIRSAVREHRPDLIHAHFGYTQLATAFHGSPFVVTLYGDDVNGESNGNGGITLRSRAGVLVTQSFSRFARRIVVQSEAMRRRMWDRVRSRCVVLGSGIDDTHFSPGSMNEARQRLGLQPDSLVLAFVNSGRQPTKRLDLAQATRDELAGKGQPVELLVAEQVPAEEIRWYYRAADVLLMTSDLEGSPNCVKEALSCGTPVVSVAVGDVPDLLTEPARGAIVERTPAALAAGVERVVTCAPAVRHSLLPHHLRASVVATRLVEIYRSVLRGE
jgi:teichuronic acid biosynthesis glycosyltransferase TuaC